MRRFGINFKYQTIFFINKSHYFLRFLEIDEEHWLSHVVILKRKSFSPVLEVPCIVRAVSSSMKDAAMSRLIQSTLILSFQPCSQDMSLSWNEGQYDRNKSVHFLFHLTGPLFQIFHLQWWLKIQVYVKIPTIRIQS